MNFSIEPLSSDLTAALQAKVDNKTKPLGSLGKLEALAVQVGRIQSSLSPQLQKPHMLVFAADHGIARSGVSAYPPEVTEQMVLNFLRGGAAVSGFCQLNGFEMTVIDAGVNADLPEHPRLVQAKIARGTANMLETPAMSAEQCLAAIEVGAKQVNKVFAAGCNTVALGEMGIGNTSSAALLMHALTPEPLERCVGRGTGLDNAGLTRKLEILQHVAVLHNVKTLGPLGVLAACGGFEIAMMCGGYLQAAQNRMLILVDGFIASVAALVASKLHPSMLDYCIFTHCSNESGHASLLQSLNVEPLVDLRMRLGEGSGAAVAYPLVAAAVHFLNHMASFEDAGVSRANGA